MNGGWPVLVMSSFVPLAQQQVFQVAMLSKQACLNAVSKRVLASQAACMATETRTSTALSGPKKISLSSAEWRKKLSPQAYNILRNGSGDPGWRFSFPLLYGGKCHAQTSVHAGSCQTTPKDIVHCSDL